MPASPAPTSPSGLVGAGTVHTGVATSRSRVGRLPDTDIGLRPPAAATPLMTSQRRTDAQTADSVASTRVVCDGPGEQRALNVEAATA